MRYFNSLFIEKCRRVEKALRVDAVSRRLVSDLDARNPYPSMESTKYTPPPQFLPNVSAHIPSKYVNLMPPEIKKIPRPIKNVYHTNHSDIREKGRVFSKEDVEKVIKFGKITQCGESNFKVENELRLTITDVARDISVICIYDPSYYGSWRVLTVTHVTRDESGKPKWI